jgi:FMN phosphatase YigB (HAD superfamily)
MKQVEKFPFPVTNTEERLSFISWCQENEVRKILIDGDDTLWETAPIIRQAETRCSEILSQVCSGDPNFWLQELNQCNNLMFDLYGVNPRRWNFVVGELSKTHPIPVEVQRIMKRILTSIYHTPLRFIDGTELGLQFLKESQTEIGIVTHANKEWTWKKYQWLGLNRFISWDDIFLVDENHHKTKESWEEAMDYFKTRPENCLIDGDSPRSDINPCCDLGVRHCFLQQNNYQIWSIHQQEVDESKVKGIRSINDLRYLGAEIIFRK